MTNHIVRLYVAAGTLVAFCLAWAGLAANPWAEEPRDPRVVVLEQREQRLQRDAALVQQIVDLRRAASQTQASAATAPVPSVRVVTLPPVATTRSS